MSSISVQRAGFTRVPELFYAITKDLIDNGFTQIFPGAPPTAPVPGADYPIFKITLEASQTVDPLHSTQPWRLQFDAKAAQIGDVYVATPIQLASDGTVATLESASQSEPQLPTGMLNSKGKLNQSEDAQTDHSDTHFLYRASRIDDRATANAYPMSYRLSITDHGIALVVWEDADDNKGVRHSWLCVQRPVDRLTGIPLTTGHCPLFCVFGLNVAVTAINAIGDSMAFPAHVSVQPFKFIVRESDVLKPTIPVQADEDTEDSHAIMNSVDQVAITENNRYVITFPNGLNTPRYMYTEELDMIAYTSADVVSAYTDVPMTVYGEGTPRVYAAMQANLPFNTGMRLLLIKQGAGIP